MPRYLVRGPDGKVHAFEGPAGATPAEVEAFAAETFGKADADKAARVAAQRAADAKSYGPPTPRAEDTTAGRLLGITDATPVLGPVVRASGEAAAGFGSGLTSVIRAVGGGRLARYLNLPDTKAEADALDAPLADTVAGSLGRVAGQAAPAAVAMLAPPTWAGAVLGGAATGAALTEGDLGDRAQGAAGGAVGGAVAKALPPVARAARGAWRGLTEPLSDAGRARIAGRAIERFSTQGPNALDNLATGPSVTGARPTLSEATRDPGLATLERAVITGDPEAAALMHARQQANNAARLQTLEGLAGDAPLPVRSSVRRLAAIQQGPSRAEAVAARSAQGGQGYRDAYAAGVDPEAAASLRPQLDELLGRPSVRQGAANARALGAEEGLNITDEGSVAGLHYLKQSLDDAVTSAARAGDMNRARLIGQTVDDLGTVLDEIAPAYRAAQAGWRQLSVPVNRQDVARRLADTTTSAVRDFAGNPTLRANQFARALTDEGRLLERSTGFGGAGRTLDDILTPTQSGRINAVRDELETLANLNSAANGPGSQTAKMLASHNLLRQIAGPLGMPESWAESVLSQTALRPAQWAYKMAEPRIASRVAEAALDPATALSLVRRARGFDAPRAMGEGERMLRELMQRSAPGLLGLGAANAASQ